VEPGTVLADRYVVEDLLAEEGDSNSWRARDRILARSVVLQILPSSSSNADELLSAAKRASRVADPRILQVLDAVDDGELVYVVREWASGQSLDVMLAEGPMPARRAAWVIREVSAAIANAHRIGLSHRRLAPDTVVITKSSGVKVIGLGTFAALRDSPSSDDDPHAADAYDLGRLLYACLTARWPGDEDTGLLVAPTEHGRLLRPRQVRAGVPRQLDAVCDRLLNEDSRYGDRITTVAEVREALTGILSDDGYNVATGGHVEPRPVPGDGASVVPPVTPPAVIDNGAGGPPPEPAYAGVATPATQTSPLGRTMLWSVLAVLLAGAVMLAYLVGQKGAQPSTEESQTATSPGGSAPASLEQLPIEDAQDFDPPPGSGDENPDMVPLAIDNDLATAWETVRYDNDPRLGGLKDGVGLILDLGQSRPVAQVTVTMQGEGTNLELRAAPESAATPPTGSVDDYQLLEEALGSGTTVTFDVHEGVRTRYLLLWLTKLPPETSSTFRGRVADVEVRG
jgi:putative peptidoglycan lipid II flippase